MSMETYVDGYVLPVKKDKLDAYKKMAQEAGEWFVKNGALAYYECVGDELTPDTGGMPIASFVDISGAAEDEVVLFSFVIYPSKDIRDKAAAMMKEAYEGDVDCSDVFDPSRMAMAGFRPIVGLQS